MNRKPETYDLPILKKRRVVRLVLRAKKPLPKWLIRFVAVAPRGTTLATVDRKADWTHIAVGASVLLAHQLSPRRHAGARSAPSASPSPTAAQRASGMRHR